MLLLGILNHAFTADCTHVDIHVQYKCDVWACLQCKYGTSFDAKTEHEVQSIAYFLSFVAHHAGWEYCVKIIITSINNCITNPLVKLKIHIKIVQVDFIFFFFLREWEERINVKFQP